MNKLLLIAGAIACCLGQAQVLPTGFSNDTLVPGLSAPVGLAFLPDGRILIVEQVTANVKVWAGGATAGLVGTVPGVNTSGGEQGLLAIAVDPQWPARPYVYVWFDSVASPNLRLAMFTLTGDLSNPTSTNLALGSQFNIVTDVPDNAPNHNGGALRFGIDGKLYLSIGDDGGGCTAQNTSSALGCIWRLDVSSLPGPGSGPPPKATLIPAGNPYAGPTDNARLVWCHGLRNPFRFHVDSVTGYLYIADVGDGAWEEISENTMGGQNMGWPWFEGATPYFGCTGAPPATVSPIATWSHATGAQSIMSLGRYRNPPFGAYDFGSAYEGDCFYLDYYVGAIRRLKLGGSTWGTPAAVPGQPNANDWATGFNMVADAATGPDGAIYYVQQFLPGFTGPGKLGRIRSGPSAVLNRISGNGQPGNAGVPSSAPLVARLTTIGGAPIAGATVHFAPIAGMGSMNPVNAVTDAQGHAQSVYTPAATFTAPPVIAATSLGAPAVNFDVVWRGVTLTYVPATSFFSLVVRHSELNSPVTICFDSPPPSPFATTAWGDVWTSILAPLPTLGYGDGLGLLGPPDAAFRTGGATPTLTIQTATLPPFGGVTLVFQAYAIDSALFPANAAFMISNAPVATLN